MRQQIIKFYIYLTLLLEDYENANSMLSEFDFTGDTPALYYARAAAEFKNGNSPKGHEWIDAAHKIYDKDLNSIFADPFYEIGWFPP